MDDKYQNYKTEIEKINYRVKEYLWKKWYLFKTWGIKQQNARCQFLARQK